MRRRHPLGHSGRRHDDHENVERWMVSYADFITLLFAFFVVMYAISSVNEGKYRVLSESLVSAFRPGLGTPPPAVPTQGGARAPEPVDPQRDTPEALRSAHTNSMRGVADDILEAMAPLVRQGQVSIVESDRGVTVEINDSILFDAGLAVLGDEAAAAMRSVARVLAGSAFPIIIEGHTDNRPISTPQFPSNWELSAVRATTVLREFIAGGVAPGRLTAIGYGDQRPAAPNDSPIGRARNRRVTIQIEAAIAPLPAAEQGKATPSR
jgi:chemotaxis protein MotB